MLQKCQKYLIPMLKKFQKYMYPMLKEYTKNTYTQCYICTKSTRIQCYMFTKKYKYSFTCIPSNTYPKRDNTCIRSRMAIHTFWMWIHGHKILFIDGHDQRAAKPPPIYLRPKRNSRIYFTYGLLPPYFQL